MAATFFFCIAVLGWGVPRTFDALTRAPAALAPGASDVSAVPNMPVRPTATAPRATVSGAATAGATPAATGGAGPGGTPAAKTGSEAPSPVPTATPAAPLSNAQQIALQQQLEQRGKAYLKALQAQDAAALGAMLAQRCQGTDVPALIARRRAEISTAAGIPIDQLTPLNQFVGHFDPFAGEAHTVLQLDDASGARIELPTADGWLLENGSWQSVNC